jgi:hypothetical protein
LLLLLLLLWPPPLVDASLPTWVEFGEPIAQQRLVPSVVEERVVVVVE